MPKVTIILTDEQMEHVNNRLTEGRYSRPDREVMRTVAAAEDQDFGNRSAGGVDIDEYERHAIHYASDEEGNACGRKMVRFGGGWSSTTCDDCWDKKPEMDAALAARLEATLAKWDGVKGEWLDTDNWDLRELLMSSADSLRY